MRILICNTYFYSRGGAETYTLALAELLRAHGHEVLFFAMNHPSNLPSPQQRFFVEYIDYPTLHRKKSVANAWKVLTRCIYYPDARKSIRRLVDELRPDVAHLQNIHAHLTPSIIAELRAASVPVVWTLHDFKLLCPEHSFYANGSTCEKCKGGRFYNCAINRCKKGSLAASVTASAEAYVHSALNLWRSVDRFIAPSRFMQEKFREFGWAEPRMEFVRNFLPDLGEPQAAGKGYGLYAGMLRPIKGVTTLLPALAGAGDPPFYIAGDGPLRVELQAQAENLSLRNTRFVGHLDRTRLAALLSDASYAVVPSECYENCPYAILEAMAAAKPVIASAHGGMAELIEHGRTGLLFEPKNVEQLAAAIRTLARDAELGTRLGAAARQFAERELTGAAHYAALHGVYADVLTARKPLDAQRSAVSSE